MDVCVCEREGGREREREREREEDVFTRGDSRRKRRHRRPM